MAGQRSSELAAINAAEMDSGANAGTSDQPMPRVPGTAGLRGSVAAQEEQLVDMSRQAADHLRAHNPSPV